MSNQYEYKIAWCPVCDQGWVEIVKDCETEILFLSCSECESEWDNPDVVTKSGTSTQGKYGMIEIPNIKEIKQKGWEIYIML